MAANMKAVKLRIKSVQSTMQITKAMELVASSKLRKAKERAEVCRPYFETMHQTLVDIAQGNTDFSSVYARESGNEKRCYVLIAGDRGLAGGYNTNLFKCLEAASVNQDFLVLRDPRLELLGLGDVAVDARSRAHEEHLELRAHARDVGVQAAHVGLVSAGVQHRAHSVLRSRVGVVGHRRCVGVEHDLFDRGQVAVHAGELDELNHRAFAHGARDQLTLDVSGQALAEDVVHKAPGTR